MPRIDLRHLSYGGNLAAYLDMIAVSEGTATSPATKDDGYDVIVTGIDKKPEIFTDYSAHPFANGRSPKQINSRGLNSSASGRYQHMRIHWKHYRDLLKLKDFGPVSQDMWAIQLIKECKAIPAIASGDIDKAIAQCRHIWASFPGAGYGQPEHGITKLVSAYRKSGGVVA